MLTSTQCVTVKLHYGLFLLTEAWHVSDTLLSLGPRTKMIWRKTADNLHRIGDMRLCCGCHRSEHADSCRVTKPKFRDTLGNVGKYLICSIFVWVKGFTSGNINKEELRCKLTASPSCLSTVSTDA